MRQLAKLPLWHQRSLGAKDVVLCKCLSWLLCMYIMCYELVKTPYFHLLPITYLNPTYVHTPPIFTFALEDPLIRTQHVTNSNGSLGSLASLARHKHCIKDLDPSSSFSLGILDLIRDQAAPDPRGVPRFFPVHTTRIAVPTSGSGFQSGFQSGSE